MEIIVRRKRASSEIPDPQYRQEAEKRALRQDGWDLDRAIRKVRSNVREDKDGRKSVDFRQ